MISKGYLGYRVSAREMEECIKGVEDSGGLTFTLIFSSSEAVKQDQRNNNPAPGVRVLLLNEWRKDAHIYAYHRVLPIKRHFVFLPIYPAAHALFLPSYLRLLLYDPQWNAAMAYLEGFSF